MSRALHVVWFAASTVFVAGCGSSAEELGPADPSTVPKVDQQEMMKKQMEEMQKRGMRPPGVMPPADMGGNSTSR